MKKSTKIIWLIIALVIILLILFYAIIKMTSNNNNNDEEKNEQNSSVNTFSIEINETEDSSEVIIEDGEIQNEELIDEFIENVKNNSDSILKIDVISEDNLKEIEIQFTKSIDYDGTNTYVIDSTTTEEDYQNLYGYYKIIIDGTEAGNYDALRWKIKKVTGENIVQLALYTHIENEEIPVICSYNLN